MKYALIFMVSVLFWYVAAVLGQAYVMWQSPNFNLGGWSPYARSLFAFWAISTSLIAVGFTWDTGRSSSKRVRSA